MADRDALTARALIASLDPDYVELGFLEPSSPTARWSGPATAPPANGPANAPVSASPSSAPPAA
ncbi:hypothetical protein ACFQVA_18265 [Actinomadura keratinilytica]